jgi:hypothetical protein
MAEVKFECWGIVEIMGHLTIAGQVSEQSIAGVNMLRIDVPAVNDLSGYTKFFGGGSIYAITPTDEESARAAAAGLRQRPVEVWKLNLPQLSASLRGDPTDDDDPEDDWEDEDEQGEFEGEPPF